MNKKAQGLSMNVIIIAAISLLVLVIIAVLVLRAGGNVNEGTGCEGVGGYCVGACDEVPEEGTFIRSNSHGCTNEGDVCCVKLGGGGD